MQYILLSFLAGILTVFAPCVFTLLPVILGSSLEGSKINKPITIISSLSISIIIFTLVLKASTVLINVPLSFWNIISGGIILFIGVITIFPNIWDNLSYRLNLSSKSNTALQKFTRKNSLIGDILTGAALGPVFSSCSPTYALILATVLPQNFTSGLINLIVYSIGLGLTLLLISILGQKLIKRLEWAVNPHGIFKRFFGIVFILIGISIITGLDKTFETYLLNNGIFDVTKIEINLLSNSNTGQNKVNPINNTVINKPDLNVTTPYEPADFTKIEDWINSKPLHIADLKGKVVLIDFWTYSCINCIRTLPYLKDWYAKYKDQGLVVIGVHTPEFAFEKLKNNVETFTKDHGIEYPVALDNNYSIWNGYNNQYWPAEYFIDRSGKVVHTHFGEGEYDKTEEIIQYLLGNSKLGSDLGNITVPISRNQSPETYIGYSKGQNFSNVSEFKPDETVNYTNQNNLLPNYWSISGKWIISQEYAQSNDDKVILKYNFSAKEVYLVMGSDSPRRVLVKINGKIVDSSNKGDDVDNNGYINVTGSRLYKLINLNQFSMSQEAELEFDGGIKVNAFTFGS